MNSSRFPGPLQIAIALSFVTILLAVVFTPLSFSQTLNIWHNGLWSLLAFAMQMSLVLVLGAVIGETPLVRSFIEKIVVHLNTNNQAVAITSLVSLVSCYINWGAGLVISALFVRELLKKYPYKNKGVLIASAYSGFLVWHSGISGSIPLKLANPSEQVLSITSAPIGVEHTIFSSFNLCLVFFVSGLIIAINTFYSSNERFPKLAKQMSFKRESISWGSIGVLLLFLASLFNLAQFNFDLNTMIFIFLGTAILLSSSINSFSDRLELKMPLAAGIFVQFIFYSGIMVVFRESGLADKFIMLFINLSSAESFLSLSFLNAGLINLFVPSGGGQWAVQGEIFMELARRFGVDFGETAMAIAWGDAWTNMLQPFWALPVLAITGGKLEEVFKVLFTHFVVVGLSLTLFFYFM